MAAEVTAIAAVAENGVIGDDGELPWDTVAGDFDHFRRETTGHPVIMGRVTYQSILDRLGHPLPDRETIVVSGSHHFKRDDVRTVRSTGSAISLALRRHDEAYVAGGESIYRALLPFCNRMLITEVPGEYEGDARFPDYRDDRWEEVSREPLDGEAVVVEYRESGDDPYA